MAASHPRMGTKSSSGCKAPICPCQVSISQPNAPAALGRSHSEGLTECSLGLWHCAESSLQHLTEPSQPRQLGPWVPAPFDRNSPFPQPAHTELGFQPGSRVLSSCGVFHRTLASSEGSATPCLAPHSSGFSGTAPAAPRPSISLHMPRCTKAAEREAQLAPVQATPWHSPGIDRCAGVEELLGH